MFKEALAFCRTLASQAEVAQLLDVPDPRLRHYRIGNEVNQFPSRRRYARTRPARWTI